MSPRRRAPTAPLVGRALGTAALLALAAVTVLPEPAARAVQGIQSGSWWRSQPDGAPLPPPPQVPDGGLWVASDAGGPSAMSALRLELGGGESAPTLRLRVHSNQSTGPPPVVACPATGPWQPATAGAWSSRPPSDCGRGKVAGVLSGDGATMTFDLAALSASGGVDVVFQPPPQEPAATPQPSPAPGVPSPPAPPSPGSAPVYDLTFERPAPTDVTAPPAPVPQPEPAEPAASLPGVESVSGPSSFLPASAFTPSAAALGPSGSQPVVAPASAPSSPAPPSEAPTALGVRPAAAHHGRGDRVLAAVVFVVLALWAWRVMSADDVRALGRSVRPRLTLYDAPELVAGAQRPRQYAQGPRLGAPPALR